MNEEQVQRLIAEAFREFSRSMEHGTISTPLHLVEGNDQAHCVAEAARETADAIRPPDPFAPKQTPEQWAGKIRTLIRLAEADGYAAEIDSDCCGCSYGDLSLYGKDQSEAFVWGRKK